MYEDLFVFDGGDYRLAAVVAQASLMDGLGAYDPFNPCGDPIGTDASGNGYDGTLGGSPVPTSGPDIVRNPTAAGSFQPTGSVNVPGLADVTFQSYSITTGFQLDELAPVNMLVTKGRAGHDVSGIGLFVAGGELVGEHEPDGTNAEQVRIGGVEAGRWYGAALTYDAVEQEMKLYLAACGLEMASNSDVLPPGSIGGNIHVALDLGANGEHDAFLRGSLDEVRIYDRVLSDAEARYLITGCVPEPGTICLLGLGGLSLLRRRRRE